MEERNLKKKLLIVLVSMAVLAGLLSGCVTETPVEEPENIEPTADFTYTVENTTVMFEDLSVDTDGNITFWAWDFGDGNTSYDTNPVHTYTEDNKTYSVTLTVDDDGGATATETKTVTVGTPSVPPTAGFIYDPMVNITTNIPIDFMDNSTAGTSTIENWTWNFGDGNYSYDQNATHQYAVNGTYTVTLTVTDANGHEDAVTEDILIGIEEV